jgi:hypothetical protein
MLTPDASACGRLGRSRWPRLPDRQPPRAVPDHRRKRPAYPSTDHIGFTVVNWRKCLSESERSLQGRTAMDGTSITVRGSCFEAGTLELIAAIRTTSKDRSAFFDPFFDPFFDYGRPGRGVRDRSLANPLPGLPQFGLAIAPFSSSKTQQTRVRMLAPANDRHFSEERCRLASSEIQI